AAKFDLGTRDLVTLFFLQRTQLKNGIRAVDLTAAVGLTSGSMSRCIDRLENKGLIKRTHHENDRRAWVLQITPRGLEVANTIRQDQSWNNIEHLYASLTDDQWHTLGDLISQLYSEL